MSVSQACNYALTALQQEFSACGKAPNSNAATDCNCTSLGNEGSPQVDHINQLSSADPESVNAYCNFPDNDKNTWSTPYLAAVDARMNACLAVNKPVVSATVIALPSNIPNPWAVQTGPLTPACTYIKEAFQQRFGNCGKGPDAKSIDTCICTGLCMYCALYMSTRLISLTSVTESFSAYCNLPGNDQASWLNLYQDGAAARSNSCAKVGLPLTAIPILSLPNNIPNPLPATATQTASAATSTTAVAPVPTAPSSTTAAVNTATAVLNTATTAPAKQTTLNASSGVVSVPLLGGMLLAYALLI
ncbi:hypothetical protein HDU79_000144 [Rhizoclosmatium sp. JEL0117]|nr:hypothetical protein HDU79_000144 [Rhizoclosmatium sp. JEL0117]